MVDGKVAVPVRVGFSTAEYGILTGVTVNGVTYKVETDSVPLATPAAARYRRIIRWEIHRMM